MSLELPEATSCSFWHLAGEYRETCGIHSARTPHRLPNFAEIDHIMREHHAAEKKCLLEAVLVHQLERNVLPDDIPVVDEEENLLAQCWAVLLAQIFVELVVILHIAIGIHRQYSVATVSLIDVVDIAKS